MGYTWVTYGYLPTYGYSVPNDCIRMYVYMYIYMYIYIYIMTASAQVTEQGGAFTLANYADGYEMWLSVQPK